MILVSEKSWSQSGLPDFLVHDAKTVKMYQMNTKCTKWSKISKNIPNVNKTFPMATKYTNIFQSKALKHLPKFGFWV
jgi:uncharacterized protein YhbP (UPF0306 family)